MTDRTVLFRKITEPRPPEWLEHIVTYWQVEYWGDEQWPFGMAWVAERPTNDNSAVVLYLFVMDDQRRQGVATQLVSEIRKRWPDVEMGPATVPGNALLAAVYPEKSEDWTSPA